MDISKLRKKVKQQAADSKRQAADKKAGESVLQDSAFKPMDQVLQETGAGQQIPEPKKQKSEPRHKEQKKQAEKAGTQSPKAADSAEATENNKPLLELAGEELKKYPPDNKERELLCFPLAEQEYAIDLSRVKEIIRVKEITPVPNTSDFVLGIVVLRGEIIPIIDLRRRIGLTFLDFNADTRFIMVSFEDALTGLVVDNIPSVKKVPVKSIQSAELVGSVDIKFLAGISTSEGDFTILLKMEEILKQADMVKE